MYVGRGSPPLPLPGRRGDAGLAHLIMPVPPEAAAPGAVRQRPPGVPFRLRDGFGEHGVDVRGPRLDGRRGDAGEGGFDAPEDVVRVLTRFAAKGADALHRNVLG